MAVAGRPQDRAVVGRASLLLRLRVYGEGETDTRARAHSESCRDRVHASTSSDRFRESRLQRQSCSNALSKTSDGYGQI